MFQCQVRYELGEVLLCFGRLHAILVAESVDLVRYEEALKELSAAAELLQEVKQDSWY